MPFLIDCFSPGEMLHMVSIANRHLILNTDQKRFLIGLRMAEIQPDGSYAVNADKVGKFNRIFGQFLNELKPGQRCDKETCPTCDRLQNLLDDFHGAQSSDEFRRFIEWFQKSTLLYTTSETTEAPPALPVGHEPKLAPAPLEPRELPVPATSSPEFFPVYAGDGADIPLFQINGQHPLVRQLRHLTQYDPGQLSDKSLRAYTATLRRHSEQLLELLGLSTLPENNVAAKCSDSA